MQTSERQLEAAERSISLLTDTRVAQIRGALCLKGDEHCNDCGDRIDVRRRLALPSAQRCIECQTKFEEGVGRGS